MVRRTEGGGMLEGATPVVEGSAVRSPRMSFGSWICNCASAAAFCDAAGCEG